MAANGAHISAVENLSKSTAAHTKLVTFDEKRAITRKRYKIDV